MKNFFCYGKNAICEKAGDNVCNACEYKNDKGGQFLDDHRGMKMKVMLDAGAKMPVRAHPWDAGLDLYTPVDATVPGCKIEGGAKEFCIGGMAEIGCAVIDTGVHVQIPEGYVGFIKSKSGLNVNHGLTGEGVIDAHYTGSIKVKLYNHTGRAYHFEAGDKIAQLVILPCALPEPEMADKLEETDRGDGGFGSTGR